MAKKKIEEGLGPMPTLNNFKAELERRLQKTSANFSVSWFLKLIEPHKPEDAPHVMMILDKRIWRWPYEERVLYLLRTYLKCDIEFQQLIVAAREDNIYWHGENMKFFLTVINETEKMRSVGIEKYRKQAKQKMKAFEQKVQAF